jgi:hypothetical protein
MSEITYAYAGDIVKTKTEDGDLIVYGKATGPDLDLDEQICDPSWLREAMPEWMKFGNVREMHQPIAAGVGLELNAEGDDWYLKSQVVDTGTAKKIEAKALTGYSIGIKGAKVVKDAVARGGRIVGGTIVEVSYVDRPCNPTAVAGIAKAVGGEWQGVEADVDKAGMTPQIPEPQAQTIQVLSDVNENQEWKPEDAYKPTTLEVDEYPSDHACAFCDGLGKLPETGIDCPHCEGTGRVMNSEAEDGDPQAAIRDRKKPEYSNSEMSQSDIDARIAAGKDAEAEMEKRDYSTAERESATESGAAMPGGSFPIKTVADLKNAIQSIGRAKDRAATIAHIKTRAAKLGREDLIPESFKSMDADTEKVEHNAADLEAVRSSLIALIKAELDEMLNGEEDEICDVRDLLCALNIFLGWWDGEAEEGETAEPFMENEGSENDSMEDEMAYVAMGVAPDTIKAAKAGGDEAIAELRNEIVKALRIDDLIETVTETAKAAQQEQITLLEAELQRVKEMAAPGGPAIARTHSQTSKALDAERMASEADRFRHIAGTVTDPELKAAYYSKAQTLSKNASEILGA